MANVIIRTMPSLDVSDVGTDLYSTAIVAVGIFVAILVGLVLLGKAG